MLSGVNTHWDMKGNLILTRKTSWLLKEVWICSTAPLKEIAPLVAHNMMPEVLVRYGLDSTLKIMDSRDQ